MKQISSRDNPTVKHAAGLKQNKHRKRDNMFILEGERAVLELSACPQRVVSFFVQEALLERYRHLIDIFGEECGYVVNEKIIKTICDTDHPQGIAAVVSIPDWNLQNVIERRGLWLLLNGIADPGNMGTIVRTARALGAAGLLYTYSSVDPYNPKALRASMGAIINFPLIGPVSAQDIVHLKGEGFRVLGTLIDRGLPYYQVQLQGDLLVVVGGEAQGMDQNIIDLCNEIVNIPMNAGVNSLNAASACAIILGEALRQRNGGALSR